MMIMVIISMRMSAIYNVLFMTVTDFINLVILHNEWTVQVRGKRNGDENIVFKMFILSVGVTFYIT